MGAKVQTALGGAQTGGILDAVATIHAHDAGVINPGDAELDLALWLHERPGNEGGLGVAVEDGRERGDVGRGGVDELFVVGVAAHGFLHQELRGLEAVLKRTSPCRRKSGLLRQLLETFIV